MDTFPRKGTELSTECEVLFTDAKMSRPAINFRMENGFEEDRFNSSSTFYTFTATLKGSDNDFNVMAAFFESHGSVERFTIVHPDLGTGTAKFAISELPLKKIINGNPRWWQLELPMKAVF